MAENLGNWPSGHGQITKIWPSDRCGGKTIPAAMQFGYNLREFGGYLGNVGLDGIWEMSDNWGELGLFAVQGMGFASCA